MPDFRRKVLEEFLNDEVMPERQKVGIYSWRDKFYQVIPYSRMRSIRVSPDSFVRIKRGRTFYGIREMSEALLKKWYGNKIGAHVPNMTRKKFRLDK